MTPSPELTLFHAPISGNSYKVVLLLSQLGRPCRIVKVDLLGGEARTEAFRGINPFGRIPYLAEGGFGLAKSNAILLYLARGSAFLPDEPRTIARIHQWMFFEQNQIETSLATLRFMLHVRRGHPLAEHAVALHRSQGVAALDVLERHLSGHDFLAGHYSVADIAVYAYTHVAPQAGIPLDPYPAVRSWIDRIEATQGFVPLGTALPGHNSLAPLERPARALR
jgi:glutathione S-transferase